MRLKPSSATLLFLLGAALLLSSSTTARCDPKETRFNLRLVWGTDDAKSPDPQHKPAPPELEKKLKNSPFKWAHYFVVTEERVNLRPGEEKSVQMSKNCSVTLKYLGDSQVRFQLFGKGQLVNTITQALPKGELLVTGGNAENSTAWFVVLKQSESQ